MPLYSEKFGDMRRVRIFAVCFHSIRFKVNKKDWLSGIDSLFLCPFFSFYFSQVYLIS